MVNHNTIPMQTNNYKKKKKTEWKNFNFPYPNALNFLDRYICNSTACKNQKYLYIPTWNNWFFLTLRSILIILLIKIPSQKSIITDDHEGRCFYYFLFQKLQAHVGSKHDYLTQVSWVWHSRIGYAWPCLINFFISYKKNI